MASLKHYRKLHGISLSWLAEQLGIDRSTLWRYERGDVKPPKSILFHAGHLMHIPLDDFDELKNDASKQ